MYIMLHFDMKIRIVMYTPYNLYVRKNYALMCRALDLVFLAILCSVL